MNHTRDAIDVDMDSMDSMDTINSRDSDENEQTSSSALTHGKGNSDGSALIWLWILKIIIIVLCIWLILVFVHRRRKTQMVEFVITTNDLADERKEIEDSVSKSGDTQEDDMINNWIETTTGSVTGAEQCEDGDDEPNFMSDVEMEVVTNDVELVSKRASNEFEEVEGRADPLHGIDNTITQY